MDLTQRVRTFGPSPARRTVVLAGRALRTNKKGSPQASLTCIRFNATGRELFPGGDALHGANLGAGAAVGAELGIDLVDIALADRAHRAFRLAGPAGGAIFSNHVGHDNLLAKFRWQCNRFPRQCQAKFRLRRQAAGGGKPILVSSVYSCIFRDDVRRKKHGTQTEKVLTYSKIVEYSAPVFDLFTLQPTEDFECMKGEVT